MPRKQLKEGNGKMLKSTTKEGLYQSDGGGKKKHEELTIDQLDDFLHGVQEDH